MSGQDGSPSGGWVQRHRKGILIGRRTSPASAPEPPGGRTRRGLLAGAAGALGLLAGETILNATPAQAGTDGDVVLGAHNTALGYTWIDTRADPYASEPALLLSASADNTQSALYVFNDTPQGSTPGPAI